jgi:acyl carrier protein
MRETIESWIVDRLAECAGFDPQDVDLALPCTAYGLDSLSGVAIVGDLELWLQLQLSPALLWEMPSVEHLAQCLAEQWLDAPEREATGAEPDQEWLAGLSLDPAIASHLLSNLDQLSDQEVEAMLLQLAA